MQGTPQTAVLCISRLNYLLKQNFVQAWKDLKILLEGICLQISLEIYETNIL